MEGVEGSDGRTEIPLRMLTGNLNVLIEGRLEVQAIQLHHDPASPGGVILGVHMNAAQKVIAAERGFKTIELERNDD